MPDTEHHFTATLYTLGSGWARPHTQGVSLKSACVMFGFPTARYRHPTRVGIRIHGVKRTNMCAHEVLAGIRLYYHGPFLVCRLTARRTARDFASDRGRQHVGEEQTDPCNSAPYSLTTTIPTEIHDAYHYCGRRTSGPAIPLDSR